MPLELREQSALRCGPGGSDTVDGVDSVDRELGGAHADETLPGPESGQPRQTNCYLIATTGSVLNAGNRAQCGFLRWAILGSNQ